MSGKGPPPPTGHRLFVANLPYHVDWKFLKDLFRDAGVHVRHADVLEDPKTGRPKGNALVEVADHAAVEQAIASLNDFEVEGRRILVREDRDPMKPIMGSGKPDHGKGGGKDGGKADYRGKADYQLDYRGKGDAPWHQSHDDAYRTRHDRYEPRQERPNDRRDDHVREREPPQVSGGGRVFIENLPPNCAWQRLKDICRDAGLRVKHADIISREHGSAVVELMDSDTPQAAVQILDGADVDGRRIRVREHVRGLERDVDRGSDRADRGLHRGLERVADRGPDRGFERGVDRDLDRTHDRRHDRGPDRTYDRGVDRTYDRGLDRANERPLERASYRSSRGYDARDDVRDYRDGGRDVRDARDVRDRHDDYGGSRNYSGSNPNIRPSQAHRVEDRSDWGANSGRRPSQGDQRPESRPALPQASREPLDEPPRGKRPPPPDTEESKQRRLFAENLAPGTDWKQLKDLFKGYFDVLYADVIDMGGDDAYGIVEFQTRTDALEACVQFNGVLLSERPIRLRQDRGEFSELRAAKRQRTDPPPAPEYEAPVKEERDVLDGRRGGHASSGYLGPTGSNRPPLGPRVYVGNLDYRVSWQDLKDHMRRAGNVLFCDVLKDQEGRSKGCALVDYATEEERDHAIATLSDTPLGSRSIYLRKAEDRGGPPRR